MPKKNKKKENLALSDYLKKLKSSHFFAIVGEIELVTSLQGCIGKFIVCILGHILNVVLLSLFQLKQDLVGPVEPKTWLDIRLDPRDACVSPRWR